MLDRLAWTQLTLGPQVTLESSDIPMTNLFSIYLGSLVDNKQNKISETSQGSQTYSPLNGGTFRSLLCLVVLT